MSDPVDAIIASVTDWRGETMSEIRRMIRAADPDAVEEVKWRKPSNPLGVATWSHARILCTGEIYKDKVKLTFFRGAALADPEQLFNTPKSGTRAAIDLREGERLEEQAFAELIREAVAVNLGAKAG